MQSIDIEQEIRAFLANTFPLAGNEKLGEDESLLGNVIDSSGVIELVTFLQERFQILVEDDEVTSDNLDSLRKVARFVEQKLRTRPNI